MTAISQSNLGFVLAPPPKGNTPVGTSLDWSGVIAKKGNTLVDIDSVSQVIGVDSIDSLECATVFSEILDIIRAWLEPDLNNKIIFYEFLANNSIKTSKNPLESIRSHKFQNDVEQSITEIIGEDYSAFSIHLSAPLNKIDDPSWYDMKIQPLTRRPDREFDVMSVYRKIDFDKVVTFAKSYDENLVKIFNKLELV